MTRNERILRYLDISGKGLEIGPSLNPVAPKRAGFNVEIVDHASEKELIRRYQQHGHDTTAIEPVDFVWKGESYSELTGKKKHYDWAIASHVIEHVPDLIAFINDCDEILKDDGVLSLVIPDKRYCFDHFRMVSSLSKVIDAHNHKEKIHTAGSAAEYYLNVVARDGAIAWGKDNHEGAFNFVHGLEEAKEAMHKVADYSSPMDVHSWCFVPNSFRLLIDDLYALGLINMREVGFFDTEGCEFYVTLGRQGKGSQVERMNLLRQIAIEVAG